MIAMILAQTNEWSYVTAAYVIVVGTLVAFAVATIVAGRRVSRQLPPEDRRWM